MSVGAVSNRKPLLHFETISITFRLLINSNRSSRMTSINPYLTFNGNCEEAFEFYRSVFGGEFATVMRMGDMDMGQPVPEAAKNLVMHVALPISEGNVLMGSDTAEGFSPPTTIGNNYSVAIGLSDRGEADRLYNGLSAGGKTTMPMADAPWGDYFGMFTDKFGIPWMINCSKAR
jgi:PhnB protein